MDKVRKPNVSEIPELFEKLSAFYGTRKYITVFTQPAAGPYPKQVGSNSKFPNLCFEDSFSYWRFIYCIIFIISLVKIIFILYKYIAFISHFKKTITYTIVEKINF
jgi:hypothetical protein